jgi:WD40 repeat protein
MKNILMLFIFLSNLFAEGIILHQNEKSIDLPLIFKATSENQINNVAISNNNKKVLITNNHKVKIFNAEDGELLKTLNFKNIKKALFSNNNKKIYILTKDVLYIYDTNTYNEIGYIKCKTYDGFKNFFLKGNLLAIIEQACCKVNIYIFNTDTNEKISSFKINDYNVYYGDFSLNLKKIAFSSPNKIRIYNLKGDLLNSIPSRGKFYEIKWLNKKELIVRSSNNNAYVFNILTGNPSATINNNGIDRIDVLDKDNILIIKNYKIKIFNTKKLKFLDKIYIIKGESSNDRINDVCLSNDKTLLAVAYKSNNMKLFDTSKAFNIKINNSNSITKKETSTIYNTNIKSEKNIIKENKKPTLFIYASQTEGTVPLKVHFKFLANDEDGKIASYYLNFIGKEFLGKGNPSKSFTYIFRRPGKYKIMVAVKDNKGAITKKEITITAKEQPIETFEDYKRKMFGK